MPRPVTPLQKKLIDCYQRGFPVTPHPYADIAAAIGSTEDAVINALADLQDRKILSRIGATYATGRAGASTLAAMAAPAENLEKIAHLISGFTGINHNYEREDKLNLWFVITGPDQEAIRQTTRAITDATGLAVHHMPMIEHYRLDLGFPLSWN
ncbi:Lrp/AsnC family transcriptional regulator [Thalassospira sp.]|uniref:Lrp/AsnC family transcriptional regulator n=1 Tax=Thalassospira sp. TaxID=1912094 RepID=UPI002734F286|nr:Lrp/AsnC family transcriptional regulator [Thalassospira sp.]MDP2699814.1 Lrp/AsnC family transcriptional regulator [Thalassospira sp.]